MSDIVAYAWDDEAVFAAQQAGEIVGQAQQIGGQTVYPIYAAPGKAGGVLAGTANQGGAPSAPLSSVNQPGSKGSGRTTLLRPGARAAPKVQAANAPASPLQLAAYNQSLSAQKNGTLQPTTPVSVLMDRARLDGVTIPPPETIAPTIADIGGRISAHKAKCRKRHKCVRAPWHMSPMDESQWCELPILTHVNIPNAIPVRLLLANPQRIYLAVSLRGAQGGTNTLLLSPSPNKNSDNTLTGYALDQFNNHIVLRSSDAPGLLGGEWWGDSDGSTICVHIVEVVLKAWPSCCPQPRKKLTID